MEPLDREDPGRSRSGRNRRIATIALAAVLVAFGVIAPLLAFGAFRTPRVSRPLIRTTPRGFYVLFPSEPRGWDARGLAIIDPETNLPSGTLVDLYFFSADMETPGQATVADGRVPLRVANNLCHETIGGLVGTDVRITVTALPQYPYQGGGVPFGYQGTPPPPIEQPPNVQAVLGTNFERVVGDQAKTQGDQRMLQAARTYELDPERCSSKLRYTGGGSFQQVPVKKPQPIPTGPFPAPPFSWCPDPRTALPVELAQGSPHDVAERFDLALTRQDMETLRALADPSVETFDGWHPTGSTHPQTVTEVPSGAYMPTVPRGCGTVVAIRTWGVQVSTKDQHASGTYLLVLRRDGWKVWGWLPGDGR